MEPERRGLVRVGFGGGTPLVPVLITAKDPGRSWDWRVGPVLMRHAIDSRRPSGCRVSIELTASVAIEAALRVSYGPVVAVLVHRLARVAASEGPASVTPAD